MSRRRVWLAIAILAAAATIFGGSALWRARGVLREAREHVSAGASFRFSVRPIVPVIPAGLESIGAPAVFHDATVFDGHLYIAGPSGLTKYDGASGAIAARYRVGAELPPAPLTSLAVGLAGDQIADQCLALIRLGDVRHRADQPRDPPAVVSLDRGLIA